MTTNQLVFDEDDPLVMAIAELARQFGVAYSTSAAGMGGSGGVVEFNGVKQTEALEHIAEALEGIANAILMVGGK
jgi:hypothetical protein